MALQGNQASGPPGPAPITLANNDRLVTSLVANEFVGVWKNRPAHAEVCNRGWQSEWYGNMVHGDTLRIPVLPRYRVIEGYSGPNADTFQSQKELTPYVDLHFRQPNKIETSKDIFDRGLYISTKLEMEKAKRKVETLVDFVESDIAVQEVEGYYRGAQSMAFPTGTTVASATNSVMVAAGPESSNFPGVKAYTKARATLTSLGVTRRELCALMSPEANEAYSRGSLNAPYELPWGSEAARKGMVTGMGKVGWKFVESVNNGTYSYGGLALTAGAGVQLNAAIAEGHQQAVCKGVPNGQTIPKNTYVQFAGSHSVNEVRGVATGALESYRTTADATAAGGTVTLPLDHKVSAATGGEGMRTRNCDSLPIQNAVVYLNGLNTSEAAVRLAMQNATVEQSMLVSRDACALVVAQPELPTGDSIVARMVTADSYRVAAAHIKWYDGDAKQYRDSLIMRWAAGVLEPVAGVILRGQEAGGAGVFV